VELDWDPILDASSIGIAVRWSRSPASLHHASLPVMSVDRGQRAVLEEAHHSSDEWTEGTGMTRRPTVPTPERPAGVVRTYRDRILDDTRHDPYAASAKPIEPTRCGECGVVYHRGRWQWILAPERAHVTRCPACRRTRDDIPAGIITLDGERLPALRAELLGLIENEAKRERGEHPMNRIMRVEDRGERIEVMTTDIHLPQRIGSAIKRAHRGELEIRYGENEYSVRVYWHS
jgi:hypothetical protein